MNENPPIGFETKCNEMFDSTKSVATLIKTIIGKHLRAYYLIRFIIARNRKVSINAQTLHKLCTIDTVRDWLNEIAVNSVSTMFISNDIIV